MIRSLLTFSALSALFGLTCLWLAGAGVQLGAALVMFGFAAFSLLTGALCLRNWAGIASAPGALPAAYAMGAGLLSVALSVLVALLNLPLWPAALLCAASVGGLALWLRPTLAPTPWPIALSLIGLGAALLLLLLSPISSPATLASQGSLPIWSDYYVHAVTIYSFSSPYLLGQDIAAAGVPRVFYHYAPFMLPVLVQSATGVSGLVAATAVLLPVGLLLALMGASALALQLGGLALLLVAFLAVIALPGPEAFFIRPAWFDFDWLLIASPGSGAAIGVAFAVLWLATHWARTPDRSWRVLSLIGATSLAIILLRVQIFMLAAPVLLGFVLLTYGPRVRRAALALLAVCVLAVLLALSLSQSARALWLDIAQPHVYFDIVLNWSHGYAEMKSGWGEIGFGALHSRNLALVLVTSIGLWAVLWPVLIALALWRKAARAADLIVPLAVVTYAALILTMPAGGNGDISEYKHRHFVFLYLLVTLGTTHLALRLIPPAARMTQAIGFAAGLGIAEVALGTKGLVFDAPDSTAMPWSKDYHSVPYTPGIVEAARFLAEHAQPGDMFVMNPARSRDWLGAQPQLISLSGVQAFIGRGDQMGRRGQCLADLAAERLALVDALEVTTDPESAMALLRDHGIRWYVRLAGDTAGWTSSGNPVLSTHDVSVYDSATQAPASLRALHCKSG